MKFMPTLVLVVILFKAVPLVFAGEVVAWGNNGDGQTEVPDHNDFTCMDGGGWHSLAIKSDGSLVAWGSNSAHECDVPSGNNYVAVSAGNYFSLALTASGSIVGWGDDADDKATPPEGDCFVAISAGDWHGDAIKNDGSIVSWGSNTSPGKYREPPAGNDFVKVSSGESHSIALRANGALVTWGHGPPVPDGNDFIDVGAGRDHSVALRKDGTIVVWGDNTFGQLENVPNDSNYLSISAGYYHSAAIKADGTVVNWGYDSGTINKPNDNNFVAVSCGGFHTLALTSSPFIHIRSPNGGEEIYSSEPYRIKWQTVGCGPQALLELSTDNGNSWSDVNTIPNTGSYDVFLPVIDSNSCLLRISDANNNEIYDASDNSFTIYPCRFKTADFVYDCTINFLDFSDFSCYWDTSVGDIHYNQVYDISYPPDGNVDSRDLSVFAAQWLSSNATPILDAIGSKSVDANEFLTFTITASDLDNDMLTFSASDLPQGANFDGQSGVFEWSPTQEHVGRHYVWFFVSDSIEMDYELVCIKVFPQSAMDYVGYWSLDENFSNTSVFDNSANGNNGVASRNTISMNVTGRINGAFSFYDEDYVDLGDIEIVNGQDMSVSAWFRTTSELFYARPLVSKLYYGVAYYLGGNLAHTNRIQFMVNNTSGTTWSDDELNDGAWHHVVGVYDGTLPSDNVILYVDGVLQAATTDYQENIKNVSEHLFIGATDYSGGFDDHFEGVIDEVMIWNRALDISEVTNLYNTP